MEMIIAKSTSVTGLETWLPDQNSTMHLCEKETGPFVRIEDYRALLAEVEALPWRREREGRVGDQFEKDDSTITVKSHSGGKVSWTWRGLYSKQEATHEVSVEQWRVLVLRTMYRGAVFTPAS